MGRREGEIRKNAKKFLNEITSSKADRNYGKRDAMSWFILFSYRKSQGCYGSLAFQCVHWKCNERSDQRRVENGDCMTSCIQITRYYVVN